MQFEAFNDLRQNLVALLLSLALISEHLYVLHERNVVFTLQSHFFEDCNKNVKLEHQLMYLNAIILFSLDNFCESEQELIVKGTTLCNRRKVL